MYNFDIHALDCEVVGKWHPELGQSIDDWLEIEATWDAAPFWYIFSSYLSMDVSTACSLYIHITSAVFLYLCVHSVQVCPEAE